MGLSPSLAQSTGDNAPPDETTTTVSPDGVTTQTASVGDDPNSGTIAPNNQPLGDALNFQADLFTGRFTYKIPIFVAPGRQGAHSL